MPAPRDRRGGGAAVRRARRATSAGLPARPPPAVPSSRCPLEQKRSHGERRFGLSLGEHFEGRAARQSVWIATGEVVLVQDQGGDLRQLFSKTSRRCEVCRCPPLCPQKSAPRKDWVSRRLLDV